MVCPNCGAEQAEGNIECIRCGIIFQKIHSHPVVPPQPSGKDKVDETERSPLGEQIKELLFSVGSSPNPFALAGRSLLLVILFVWGLMFFVHPISDNYTGESFLHLVNLPFHEAGHIFFGLFGEFIAALGGKPGAIAHALDLPVLLPHPDA